MALSDLGDFAENIKGRILQGYVYDASASSYQTLGTLQSVEFSYSPVTQDADVAGREKQIAWDVEVTAVMQQTSGNEFSAAGDLIDPSGSGHEFKFVDRLAEPSTTDGFTFKNALPNLEGTFDGSGEGSNFTLTFSGRILAGNLSKTSISFDA